MLESASLSMHQTIVSAHEQVMGPTCLYMCIHPPIVSSYMCNRRGKLWNNVGHEPHFDPRTDVSSINISGIILVVNIIVR